MFWRLRSGAPTNPSKIANTFASERQMSYTNKTISQHIDFLADAFLIEKAQRYDIKGRKYIGANLKYYFTDLGLRNARLNFRQQEPTHIMENIVYNELCIRGYHVDVGIVEAFGRDSSGKRLRKQLEVDFVVNQASQQILYPGCLRPHLGGEAGSRNSTRSAISRTRSRKSSS